MCAQLKRCSKCGAEKPLSGYTLQPNGKPYGAQCKACLAAAARARRQANPAYVREVRLQWWRANREERLAKHQAWRKANPALIHSYEVRQRAEHPERIAAATRRYAQSHPDEIRIRLRAWQSANIEHVRQKKTAWRKANPERASAQGRASWMARRARDGAAVSPLVIEKILKNPCVYCGAPPEHVDHIRPVARGGTNHEDNLVPACRSCNFSKHAKLLTEWDPVRVLHAASVSPKVAAELARQEAA